MASPYPERSQQELDRLSKEADRIYDKELKDKPLGDQRAIQFNLLNRWYQSLKPAGDVSADIMVGRTRIRAFGSMAKAREAYDKEFGKTNPIVDPTTGEPIPPPYFPGGLSISTEIPQMWTYDLRQDASGNLVFPPHIQIHEAEHEIKMQDPRFADPHQMIINENYVQPRPPEKGLFERLFQ